MEPTETTEAAPTKSLDGVVGGVAALNFERGVYVNFEVEFTMAGQNGEDYVVHFYFPKDRPNDHKLKTYWLQTFPVALSDVSQDFFNATSPRLRAAYTEELASWWFRGFGLATGLDPALRIQKFFEKLDQALTAKNQT